MSSRGRRKTTPNVTLVKFKHLSLSVSVFIVVDLRPVYTGDFCRSNSMQFLSQQNRIRFQTCSKPLRYLGDKSHLVYTCDFEAATLPRQKSHRVAATKIACVNGPLRLRKKPQHPSFFCLPFSSCGRLEQQYHRYKQLHPTWKSSSFPYSFCVRWEYHSNQENQSLYLSLRQ